MGYFYLSWMIVSAAAVHVLCQELTTSLPEGNDACARNEVTFTCTIRGSASLIRLVLTWRSDEYIGNALRFTTADDPGENVTSMVNGNVTAVLINNAMIDGVPVLVSELRIVSANQDSTITCDSETSSSRPNSTDYIVPVFPNSPRNVTARQVSQNCDLSLTWNDPVNTDPNGLTYKIYVPSRDIVIADVSDTNHEFSVINCRDDDVRVLVAAVNRFGCEGQNSSAVRVQLSSLEAQLGPGAIAGIVVVLILLVVWASKDDSEEEQERQQLRVEKFCVKVFDGLKWGVHPSELIPESMLESLERKSATNVQKGLISFINKKLTSATHISFVLRRLKRLNLYVMSTFDTELERAGSSVTMDKLIEEANKGKRGELTRELETLLRGLTELLEADPERVKELLWNFFEELRNVKEKDELLNVIDKLENVKSNPSSNTAQNELQEAIDSLNDIRAYMEEVYYAEAYATAMQNPEYAVVDKPKKGQSSPGVYQDPISIQHEQAPSTGDVYAMPPGKKHKKKGPSEQELAMMYCIPDKKSQLTYTKLDVGGASKPGPP